MEINSNLLLELAKPFNGNELELLTKSENLLLFQLKQLQNILFLSVCGDKNIQKYIDEVIFNFSFIVRIGFRIYGSTYV